MNRDAIGAGDKRSVAIRVATRRCVARVVAAWIPEIDGADIGAVELLSINVNGDGVVTD